MNAPESSPPAVPAPVPPVRRWLGALRWFRFLVWLVCAFLLSAAAGLAAAPNLKVLTGICLGLFAVFVIALIWWRAWFLSPSARRLQVAIGIGIVGLLGYMAWDDATVRRPLTMEGVTPLPPRGAESGALYDRMAIPKNGEVPFSVPTIVRREPSGDPVKWRAFIETNRDAIRADWEAATALRAWIAGLDEFELIGDTSTSWDSLPSTFRAMRTASHLHCDYASLLALEGRGDEAVAVLAPLLSVSYKLQPTARTLVRYMVAVVVQGMGQDTARFILANAQPSPGAVRSLATVLARGTAAGPNLHRVLLSEYAGALKSVLLEDGHPLPAPFARIPRQVFAIVYNPRGTANLLAASYEQIATAAASRNLAELHGSDPAWWVELSRPALKNPGGRLMVQMAVPAFQKVTESSWKKDDDRRALLTEVRQRLAAIEGASPPAK